ncbi:SMP-30/gluconolactonase/LRE family protein [Larkinella terrae]|uniref:SMP-30/gluconolactonase/LRE family protein n=1 Tax=Larkinella terrae TaxID=2025311 RepID=A0A7K0EUN2_9BACT|nr:SMP-30/gluconolactonase/LRE family protein [Larkinella terrae]MRS65525.1 SMP-30/gluconolactonase/LRE family protein [Larkinella terrae]
MKKSVLSVLLMAGSCLAMAQTPYPSIGFIERLDPKLDALLSKDAKLEVLASGFDWSEGPVWVKGSGNTGSYLLFSDVPQNTVFKWTEKEGSKVFMKPSGYTGVADYGGEPGSNGLALDAKGRLISAEHGDRRISALVLNGVSGGKKTLADNYGGKRFNSPNDVAPHSSGSVYFTDPPYGLPGREKDTKTRELDIHGVYRVAPDGKVTLIISDLTRPNGIAFSPDEKTLYIAQSDPEKPYVMAYPVQADGTVGKGRIFYDATEGVKQNWPGLPDGLKVDKNGTVWTSGPGGILVIAPDRADGPGKLLGRLRTGVATANCAFGDDGSTLYITADMYLIRVKTLTKGL